VLKLKKRKKQAVAVPAHTIKAPDPEADRYYTSQKSSFKTAGFDSLMKKVNLEVAEKLRKKYKTDPKTGITDLSKRAGKDSPGYKKGKYWLRNEGKYADVGSQEHKADLSKRKK
jgi:hypothetical protein